MCQSKTVQKDHRNIAALERHNTFRVIFLIYAKWYQTAYAGAWRRNGREVKKALGTAAASTSGYFIKMSLFNYPGMCCLLKIAFFRSKCTQFGKLKAIHRAVDSCHERVQSIEWDFLDQPNGFFRDFLLLPKGKSESNILLLLLLLLPSFVVRKVLTEMSLEIGKSFWKIAFSFG